MKGNKLVLIVTALLTTLALGLPARVSAQVPTAPGDLEAFGEGMTSGSEINGTFPYNCDIIVTFIGQV